MDTQIEPPTCPCCGKPVDKVEVEALEDAPLSYTRKSIVRRLISAYPRMVSAETLMNAMYGGAREPENARLSLAVTMTAIRKILRPHGWTISRSKGGQANKGYFKLERTDAEAEAA
ncbi:hypothetical protein [Pararhizobium mangrovi]|uniref:Helix-turn-helix domain-containing protein n=1 Tax=Pararhizobium mangrovi TaxID=2590452 RepID=A0A506TXH8_9HYPH|nr:hypothetical protein [Pararhizobium mangrovi]TPW26016.1 hypothetical protein FJU11_16505 [Pararhizobium mangrovi]